MKMKFFAKHNAKIDPRSRKFVEIVMDMLEKHGISDEIQRKKCSFYLFQSTIKYYRKLQSVFEKGVDSIDEESAEKQENEMIDILSKFGITEKEKQEGILVEYFTTLTEMGMWVAGESK